MVSRVTKLRLNVARYQPLRGGSYPPLPKAVKDKKAVKNVKNKDNHCLRWSLGAALFPADKNPQRPSKYPTEDGLKLGVSAPTHFSKLDLVERQNHPAMDVYGWADGGVVTRRLSKAEVAFETIDLFLITNGVQHHYTWFKYLNRLLNQQSQHAHQIHFCERCLHGFTREELLEKHKPDCRSINQAAVAIEMPKPGTDQA